MNKISIVGCGWLGLSLGAQLAKNGFVVKGSTTTKNKLEQLHNNGIDGFIIELNETNIIGNYSECLKESDTIIINIPPGLRSHPDKNHVAEIAHLIAEIEANKIKNVLYIGSTSVFRDTNNFSVITNLTTPNNNTKSSKQLIEIEQTLRNNSNFNTTILRFGGLFGEDRHPANHLSGRKDVANPNAPINLIHKLDCINIIHLILKNNIWNLDLNASYPIDTNKKTYYTNYCKKHKLPIPEFNTIKKSVGKRIDSSYLVQLLNYTFQEAP